MPTKKLSNPLVTQKGSDPESNSIRDKNEKRMMSRGEGIIQHPMTDIDTGGLKKMTYSAGKK